MSISDNQNYIKELLPALQHTIHGISARLNEAMDHSKEAKISALIRTITGLEQPLETAIILYKTLLFFMLEFEIKL